MTTGTVIPFDQALERFRAYLTVLARLQLGRRFPGKLDPSDVVQQTLLDAHRKRDQFRGTCEGELVAWLRQALAHTLADAARALGRAKRDVALERSLEAGLGDSSCRLAAWLAADQSSPSQRASKDEELLRLAEALEELPRAQRDAVMRHHLQGWSLAEVARELGRSEAAVAGLLHRGLKRLRELLEAGS